MLVKEMLFAYYQTQCLHIVATLKVADYLQDGPQNLANFAKKHKIQENKLYRIMRFVSALGLFDELEGKQFSLNDNSKGLLSSAKGNINHFIQLHGEYFYQSAPKLIDSLSSDNTSFALEFGDSAVKFFTKDSTAKEIYNLAMSENSEVIAKEVISSYDFSKYNNIIDLGGGVGSLLANILIKYENAKGVNFDLPGVEEAFTTYFKKRNLENRCEFIGGDLLKAIPENGDIYLMKAILHGKSDDVCKQILQIIKQQLSLATPLLLIERAFSQTSKQDFINCCINDINMLNVTQGCVRNLGEYISILKDIDYKVVKTYSLSDGIVMLECYRN